jgi:hypothetical protein
VHELSLRNLKKSQEISRVYLNMNGIAIGYIIMVSDEVIIPMTTLNIFNRMRYLLRFFGI